MKQFMERGEHIWSNDSTRLIITASQEAKATYFYLQEVGSFKTKPPYFCERQYLDSYLLVYTLSGTGCLHYLDNTYTISEGDCFYINCQNHHLYEATSDWEFLWFHFNGPNALGFYTLFVKSDFHIINTKDTPIPQYIFSMIELYSSKNRSTELQVTGLITNTLTCLLLQDSESHSSLPSVPTYINDIVTDIEKNYRNKLSLSYFEKKYYRSRYHILKEFKKYIGTTVTEYLILTRISQAKELLKYTDFSVNEIALEIGFNHTTHFINLFKIREGHTPHSYRKTWREVIVQ